MTAYSSTEHAGSFILQGAADYIAKPFRADQLRRVCEIASRRKDFLITNLEFTAKSLELEHEKRQAQITLASLGDAVISTNASGEITYINSSAQHLMGWESEEVTGYLAHEVMISVNSYSGRIIDHPIKLALQKKSPMELVETAAFISREGKRIHVAGNVSLINDQNGAINGSVMVFHDCTEKQKITQRLAYHVSHDSLTGLINRNEFEHQLRQLYYDGLPETKTGHVLCYLDLDQFKLINDTKGHHIGDLLLCEVSKFLQQRLRQQRDIFARLGGDEFGLLMENCSIENGVKVANDICTNLRSHTFLLEENKYSLSVTIGVVALDQQVSMAQALIAADVACHLAKQQGRDRIHLYQESDKAITQIHGEMEVITTIKQALEQDRFQLFYQELTPNEIDALSVIPSHYEILLRLEDNNGRLIQPNLFLPAAEHYNLACRIDYWVIRSVCVWLHKYSERIAETATFAINLSGLSLNHYGLIDYIKGQLKQYSIPAEILSFEITETAAITNITQAITFIHSIRELGCKVALDDFGSGMSSFAYLKQLPVDILKIDGMFIRNILTDPIDLAMVKSVNDIAHLLGLKTVAEFVETEAIQTEIQKLGVDFSQGYLFGRPKPLEKLILSDNDG